MIAPQPIHDKPFYRTGGLILKESGKGPTQTPASCSKMDIGTAYQRNRVQSRISPLRDCTLAYAQKERFVKLQNLVIFSRSPRATSEKPRRRIASTSVMRRAVVAEGVMQEAACHGGWEEAPLLTLHRAAAACFGPFCVEVAVLVVVCWALRRRALRPVREEPLTEEEVDAKCAAMRPDPLVSGGDACRRERCISRRVGTTVTLDGKQVFSHASTRRPFFVQPKIDRGWGAVIEPR